MHKLFRDRRGDTIVEVLIAIAIVSSVLAITYSIMHRNLLTMRENQERSEALRLAQGQIEAMRNMWDIDRTLITTLTNRTFCMNGDASVLQNSISQTEFMSNTQNDPRANYETLCRSGDIYRIAVLSGPATGLGSNTFSVYVRWDNLLDYTSEVRLVYAFTN